jgi:hypothetical protein
VLCKDLDKQLKITQSIAPAVYTATANGASIDRAAGGSGSVAIVFTVGAIVASGLITPSVQDSADNSSFTDVAAASLSTALVNMVAATQQETAYLGSKRYLRATGTYVSGTSVAFSATIIEARGAVPA